MKTYSSLLFLFLLNLSAHSLYSQTSSCWSNCRGNAELQGVSPAKLPDRPELLWNFNTGDGIKGAPVLCDGVIVVGTMDGSLFGINEDGSLKWKIMTENGIESPALIVEGTAYIGDLYGMLYAVDLQTGAIRWTYETENSIMGSPSFYSSGGKDILLVGSYDYYLHGVNPASGKGLWKYETNNFVNVASGLYQGMAVFGGCDGHLHLVDVLTGQARASLEISSYVASSAAISGDMAYVGDYDGYFLAVDLKRKKVNWVFENKEANLPFIGSPSVEGKQVFIGNRDKMLYCLNKDDGKLVWKYNTGGRVDASPVVVDKRVLVASMRGDLFLLDQKNGKPLWTWELGTPVHANPAVVDQRFYVGGDDGRLYCFGKK